FTQLRYFAQRGRALNERKNIGLRFIGTTKSMKDAFWGGRCSWVTTDFLCIQIRHECKGSNRIRGGGRKPLRACRCNSGSGWGSGHRSSSGLRGKSWRCELHEMQSIHVRCLLSLAFYSSFCGLGLFCPLRSLLTYFFCRSGLSLSFSSFVLSIKLLNFSFDLVNSSLDFRIRTAPVGLFRVRYSLFQRSNLVLVLTNLVAGNKTNFFPLIL